MTERTRRLPLDAAHERRRAIVRALLTAAPLALALAHAAPDAHAAEPARPAEPVDFDLLEFLGSGDDGDPELQRFLAAEPTAATQTRSPNTKPAAGTPAPGTGSTTR